MPESGSRSNPVLRDRLFDDLEAGLAAALAETSPAPGLLSLTLALPDGFVPSPPPAAGDWRYLSRPESGHHLLGVETAARRATAGPGRFAALSDFRASETRSWRHLDPQGTGLGPRAFVGFAFAPAAGPVTASDLLPNAELAVPRVLLQAADGKAAVTFTGRFRRDRDAAVLKDAWTRALRRAFAPPGEARSPRRLRRLSSPPEDAAWLARARRAIDDIRAGKLEKVVLSRRIRVAADGAFAPGPILDALAARHPSCTLFTFGAGPVTAVGASPERLVSLDAGRIRADALAGTLARGDGAPEDASLGAALLASEKEGLEHRLVVEAMADALAPACSEMSIPDRPQLLRLSSLQHLRTPITARARPGVTLLDLVARLHPTPAVGGSPNRVALDWLAREGEARLGWYTGGVGWITPDGDGEVSVVLRCAALSGTEAVLSAGAGLVAASDPEAELAETELKLRTMLDALEGVR